jgi:hypothetical protein
MTIIGVIAAMVVAGSTERQVVGLTYYAEREGGMRTSRESRSCTDGHTRNGLAPTVIVAGARGSPAWCRAFAQRVCVSG